MKLSRNDYREIQKKLEKVFDAVPYGEYVSLSIIPPEKNKILKMTFRKRTKDTPLEFSRGLRGSSSVLKNISDADFDLLKPSKEHWKKIQLFMLEHGVNRATKELGIMSKSTYSKIKKDPAKAKAKTLRDACERIDQFNKNNNI